jgi:uncharacterized protein (DUF2384 family)
MSNDNKTSFGERRKLRNYVNALFANDRTARKWMHAPNDNLDGARPSDLIRTRTGAARVEKMIRETEMFYDSCCC